MKHTRCFYVKVASWTKIYECKIFSSTKLYQGVKRSIKLNNPHDTISLDIIGPEQKVAARDIILKNQDQFNFRS